MAETATETPKKRGPGRPKGLGKVPGSGRKKGTPDRNRAATVERIQQECDPIGFLMQVARGVRISAGSEPGAKKKSWQLPTTEQRVHAATVLAKKVMPDMKAVEHSGPVGEPLIVRINLGA